MENIHYSFSNICAKQKFDLDDVIDELRRVYNKREKALAISFSGVSNAVDSMIYPPEPQRSDEFIRYHNALIVAESLRKSGKTDISLNPKQDMCEQILAMAHPNMRVTGQWMGTKFPALRGAGSLGEP